MLRSCRWLDVRGPIDVFERGRIGRLHLGSLAVEDAIVESEEAIPGNCITHARFNTEKEGRLRLFRSDEFEPVELDTTIRGFAAFAVGDPNADFSEALQFQIFELNAGAVIEEVDQHIEAIFAVEE